ncbi:hypothetical protein BW737_010330 [Actinomyces ruminis]|uniref:Uncharacterized protein n=1 Tax=Actinomyces ruminis TaxID=1937003 RepID=A0ABX4MA73_9ACTO|nr:hypothetical protein BW737_010330 [Actinomyces ruminis]
MFAFVRETDGVSSPSEQMVVWMPMAAAVRAMTAMAAAMMRGFRLRRGGTAFGVAAAMVPRSDAKEADS